MLDTPVNAVSTDIKFTRKERQLLEALTSHPNCILSRSYLLRNVWGYSEHAQSRTVDVHIRRLRQKLAGHPTLRIHTIFGKGYVMENRPAPNGAPRVPEPAPGLSVSL